MTHICVDGHYYSRLAHTVDVRQQHLSAEAYEALVEALPEKEILWELPFQGQSLPLDTKALTVDHLTVEEAEQLRYLPELERLDGSAASEIAGLAQLAKLCPQCRVQYQKKVGSGIWHSGEAVLIGRDASAQELQEALPLFPDCKELTLTGALPAREALDELQAAFPAVELSWEASLNGVTYSKDTQETTVRGNASREELEALVSYLPELKKLNMGGCSLTAEELTQLQQQYPGVFFLTNVTLFDTVFSTDAEKLDLSGNQVTDLEALEALLECFPKLTKVEMCGCGVDNDAMDALNRRHEDISFVWTVKLGWKEVRTDIRWFMPFLMNMYTTTNNETIANLRYCTDLEVVDIGHMPVTNCDWAEPLTNLKYLIMGDGPMQNIDGLKNHTQLVYLEMFKVPVRDYTPLLSCTGLRDLNIGYTYGDPGVIAQMTWLENLWWHNPWTLHWEYQDGWDHLKEKMPGVNISQYHSTSSTDHGWRELPNYYAQRDILGMFYMEG